MDKLHSSFEPIGGTGLVQETSVYRQILESISQGVTVAGPDRRLLSVNQAFQTMTGYTQDELIGRSCALLQGPGSDPQIIARMNAALAAGRPFAGELLNYRKDGSTFYNDLSIDPVFGADAQLAYFVGVQRDFSLRKAQQAELRLCSQVFSQAREGIVVTDAQGSIQLVNHAFTDISGFDQDDVIGQNPRLLSSGRQDKDFYRVMWESLRMRGVWQGEVTNRNKAGQEYSEWLTISVVRDDQGNVTNYVGTFTDITAFKAASADVQRLAHFDMLTGLPNRVLMAERCVQHMRNALRDRKTLTLLVLGLDRFKTINETLGLASGDLVLRQCADRLVDAVRETDVVARVGGDEFAVLVPDCGPESAALLAVKLMRMVAVPFVVTAEVVNLNSSIGIAVYPGDGGDFDGLLQSAEAALHQAKSLGGAQHLFYSAERSTATKAQASLVAALRLAIALDQMQLCYQPVADLQTGRLCGMEGLLQWTHPEHGQVPSARFIPLAEQSGLIEEIGIWTIQQVCRDIRAWLDKGTAVPPISLNLSAVQLRAGAVAGVVERALGAFGIKPDRLCLELTEGALMENGSHNLAQLQALKALGVALALDDFGTGHSSFGYLKQFPFDKVRIGRSFIQGTSSNPQDAVVAKVVMSMAHGLGLRVVAVGVETEAQCEFLRLNMCDEIQGGLFSAPVAAAEMAALLAQDLRLPAHWLRFQTRQRRLLLVDDEPNVVSALKRLLRGDGYEILTASSGAEALQMLSDHTVDVILSDQRMPGMTGIEFLRAAKSLHPDTVRLVLSGYTELQSVTDAINEGAVYGFLTKPWDDRHLRNVIQEAFRHKELADENEQLHARIRTTNQELATSNRILQEVLSRKQQQIGQGQVLLDVTRDALQCVGVPLIGLDDDGMVAFANLQAQALFSSHPDLLGSDLADALPELDAALEGLAEDATAVLPWGAHRWLVQWHRLGEHSAARGRIVTLTIEPGGSFDGCNSAGD